MDTDGYVSLTIFMGLVPIDSHHKIRSVGCPMLECLHFDSLVLVK
jgi:hypothetical protein